MASIQTVITLTHGKEVIQTIKDKLLKPPTKPKEQAVAMHSYFNALAGSDRDAKIVAQVNSGDAVNASATLTVASGAIGDTAVVNLVTFTAVDHRETTNITLAADSGGSLNSTFFTFQDQSGANRYYIWFNINSLGVDPKPTGYNPANGIKVNGATNVTAATLATATTAAIVAAGPIGVLATNGASTHTILTTLVAGVATKVTDGSAATSFVFTRSITGSAVSSVQYNVGTSDTLTAANLAAAINAKSTMNQVATATSAAAVVTVSSWFPGPVGNLITLTASAGNTASGAVLASGAIATTYSSQNTYHLGV